MPLSADAGGVPSIRVGDLDGLGQGGSCIAGIPLDGNVADPTFLAQIQSDPNCFSFVETIPTGFVPRFGGDNEDFISEDDDEPLKKYVEDEDIEVF